MADNPEKYLEQLERQIADLRQRGYKPTATLLAQLEEQKVRVRLNDEAKAAREKERADAEAAKTARHEEVLEGALKAEALQAYTAAGGKASDFEKQWPELRAKIVEQRTLDQLHGSDAAIVANKKANRIYSGL